MIKTMQSWFIIMSVALYASGKSAQAVPQTNDHEIAKMVELGYALPKSNRWGSWHFRPLKDESHTYGAVFFDPHDKSQMIVALRGTSNEEDWIANAAALHVPCLMCDASSVSSDVAIHAGFYTRALHIGQLLKDVMKTIGSKKTSMIFSGHSQGGAVASVLTMLWQQSKHPIKQLITFGAALAGDHDFVIALKKIVPLQRHYVLMSDPVPVGYNLIENFLGVVHDRAFEKGKGFKKIQDSFEPYAHEVKLFSVLCPLNAMVSIMQSKSFHKMRGLLNHGMECYISALSTPHVIDSKTKNGRDIQVLQALLGDWLNLNQQGLEDQSE